MRISDWSSDVCSSDLRRRKIQRLAARPCDGLDQIGPIAAGVQYLDDKAVLQRPGDRDHVFARHAVSPFVSSGRWRSRSPKPIRTTPAMTAYIAIAHATEMIVAGDFISTTKQGNVHITTTI